jgi:hypothetical protein
MKMDGENSPFVIESFELPALESKIQQLYDGYHSRKSDDDYLGCLMDVLKMRKEMINQQFKSTPKVVLHFERINKLLADNTENLLSKTKQLYQQTKANQLAGDDFYDEFHIEGTVYIEFRGESSLLQIEPDENGGKCNYLSMAEILYFTPNHQCEPLLSFHLHYPEHIPLHLINEQLNDDQFLWKGKENCDDELHRIAKLHHFPYICYALRGLLVHSYYSFSDIIRINNIGCNVKIDWQNKGKQDS